MVVIVAIAGLALGFLVILLISLSSPRAQEVSDVSANGAAKSIAHGWISRMDAEQLARLLSMLFGELKYEVEDTRIGDGVVDLFAVNPTPITRGRIYLPGIAHPPLGVGGEDEGRTALDTARAEMPGKALVATGGGF